MKDTYMDDHACAFRDVMICYRSDKERVRVPSRVAGVKLKRLGAGALCCPNAQDLKLDEGYESLSADVISRLLRKGRGGKLLLKLPESLRAVEGQTPYEAASSADDSLFLRVELTRGLSLSQYRALKESSVPTSGGLRLPMEPLRQGSPCRLMADVLRAGGMGVIDPLNVELPLFSLNEQGVRPMLFEPKACLSPVERHPVSTENEALLRRIARGEWGARNVEAERWNDRMQQAGEEILAKRRNVAVICFDERTAVRVSGRVRLTLQVYIGKLFQVSLRRVRLRGEDYFVYTRLYPQPEGSQSAYLREDVCVYGRERMLTDPALSEEVYEKFRLLNML